MPKSTFLKENSLSIALLIIFIVLLVGEAFFGFGDFNETLKERNLVPIDFFSYLKTGHFLSATFENWESEFLAVASIASMFLRQYGSPESKPVDTPRHENLDIRLFYD